MSKKVDEKKVCFIICSNDQLYTEECIYYIAHLHVPAGYQIDVLTIEDARSMTAGYNEGMHASDAKYKVYLHQDTLIVNKNFIQDFLDVFMQDETIGMIGMVGAPELPDSGIMWEAPRCGALYTWNIHETKESWMAEDALTQVEVIDGFLMITQYDIPWREDLFDKWDFYDCSQSKEFAKHGYKVVVPKLGKPWCIHDSGYVSVLNYEEERIKFLNEYRETMICATSDDKFYGATVVLVSYNRKEQLRESLEWLVDVDGVSNIIVVDNGSIDGTADWLSSQQYEYLWFDEGVQGYGKLWNTVLKNFETEEFIVFMEAGVFPEKRSLVQLVSTMKRERAEMISPSVSYGDVKPVRSGKKDNQGEQVLAANWRIWVAQKEIFVKNGLFCEKLKEPKNVLTDYSLRMIKNHLKLWNCSHAYASGNIYRCDEIYNDARKWKLEDRIYMKTGWSMNYFNLKPNYALVNYIQEPAEKKFKVLEVGCDLGATLFEIQKKFPNCKTYGMDINRAAIDIARNIAKAEYGNIDELEIPFEEKFDYIIFGDVLEHLRHPEEVVRMCYDILNENGYIIACVPNVMHISVMEELIEGRFRYSYGGLLDRTHIHFFTYYEIMTLFQSAGYVVENMDMLDYGITEREKEIMEVLLRLSDNTEDWMYKAFQYTVKAHKSTDLKN